MGDEQRDAGSDVSPVSHVPPAVHASPAVHVSPAIHESDVPAANRDKTVPVQDVGTAKGSIPHDSATAAAAPDQVTGTWQGVSSGQYDAATSPTGNFTPGESRTIDVSADVGDASIAYEVRPIKRTLPKSIGDYDVRRELGRGGMGVVYLARHRTLDRDVALKMVLDAAHADANQLLRFTTEARAVAHLQHPNIVQIFEVGEHEGLPFFSLEFVDGPTLKEHQGGKPLVPRDAAEIVEKLARAMQYAHDHQVLHRDLKPANILLTKSGVPKISDFGLAKRLSDDGDSASTRTGTVMGTPSYMSPEQARGEIKQLTPASDQYSLGALMYELLTGRPPFLASRPVDTVMQVIHEEPVPPRRTQPTLPIDIETICLKALQKEPYKRYADCGALADDVHRFLVGEPILARPVGAIERVQRWCRRNPKLAALSAFSAILLVAVVVILAISTATLSHKNSLIADQNKNLKTARDIADEQRGVAERERGVAQDERKVAVDQASLALETIQTLIDKVMTQIGDTPNTHALKKDLLETALQGAARVTEHNQQTSREATILAARQKLGDLYLKLGESEKAFGEFEFVYQQAGERAKTQGGTDASRYNAAVMSVTMSDMYQSVKRDLDSTRRLLEEAAGRYQDILDNPKPGHGEMPAYLVRLGMQNVSNRLAVLHVRSGDPAKALVEFRRSHDMLVEVANSLKDDSDLATMEPAALAKEQARRDQIRSALPDMEATAVLAVGGMLHRLRQPVEAEPFYRRAVEARENLYAAKPTDVKAKLQLGRTVGMLGDFLFQSGKADLAEPLYVRAIELAHELVIADGQMVDYRKEEASWHYRLGQLYDQLRQQDKAMEHFQASRQMRESLVTPENPNVKRQMDWMLALARCGEHAKATELAERIRSDSKPDNEVLLELTRCYALAAVSAHDQPELAQGYSQRALASLREALEGGYSDLFTLEVDADLASLRDDEAYRALINDRAAVNAAKPNP